MTLTLSSWDKELSNPRNIFICVCWCLVLLSSAGPAERTYLKTVPPPFLLSAQTVNGVIGWNEGDWQRLTILIMKVGEIRLLRRQECVNDMGQGFLMHVSMCMLCVHSHMPAHCRLHCSSARLQSWIVFAWKQCVCVSAKRPQQYSLRNPKAVHRSCSVMPHIYGSLLALCSRARGNTWCVPICQTMDQFPLCPWKDSGIVSLGQLNL